MINRINHSTQNKQTSFGMSKWENTELLANCHNLTEWGAKAIKKYVTEEAPNDGHDLIMTVNSVDNADKKIKIGYKDSQEGFNLVLALFPFFKPETTIYDVKNDNIVDKMKEAVSLLANKITQDGSHSATINKKRKILIG